MREAGREYGLTLDLDNFSQPLDVSGLRLEIWGTPWANAHDGQRGNCLKETDPTIAATANARSRRSTRRTPPRPT